LARGTEWQVAARVDEVLEGLPISTLVGDVEVCLLRVGDRFYAIDNLCTHAEASLADGTQYGVILECPRHGGRFNIETGEAVHYPAFAPVRTYPVRVDGDRLLVRVD
jgi:3-phenylpropionate/trans-cinnamate dioxygenase ferredoxin subunit